MCGLIGGMFLSENQIKQGLLKIQHRGRDSSKIYADEKIGLGFNRLAIIDLDNRADQPMANEDESIWLVASGEIWNYQHLRRQLQSSHRFRSQGDSEIIIHAYEEWGVDFLKRVDGMFSLAVYDKNQNKIILARDWVGKIPFYYLVNQDKLAFANEIKGLMHLDHYSFDKISEVMPGHYLAFDINTSQLFSQAYYQIPEFVVEADIKEIGRNINRLLKEGVKNRLISDVPLCTLLSGGIDSLTLTYCLKQYKHDIEAYVVSLGQSNGNDDLFFARKAAKWLDVPLHEVIIEQDEIFKVIPDIVYALEQSKFYQVQAAVANYFLAKAISQDGFKVALSGEGSDEIWGAYDTTRDFAGTLGFREVRKELIQNIHRGNLARLNKVMLYAGTIEMRSPFLHRPLVEYCLNIPEHLIVHKSHRKYPLIKAFENEIPYDMLIRPKTTIQDGTKISKILSSETRFYQEILEQIFRRH